MLPALATLVVVSIVGVVSVSSSNFTNIEMVSSPSLFSPFLGQLQSTNRVLAIMVATYFVVASSFSLGQLASRYKLYERAYFIQLPLSAILSWGVAQSSEYLLSSVIIFVMVRFVGSLFRAVRSDVSVAPIFDASLWLSLLPLLYAPAVLLWIIMPIFLLTISITSREWIISFVGLLVAPLVALYVSWLRGGEFGDIAIDYWSQLRSNSHLMSIERIPLLELSMIAISLLLSVIGMFIATFSECHPRTKVRLAMLSLMVVICSASLLLPSSSLISITLMVPALALLSALSLVRLHGLFVNLLYLALVVLFFLNTLVPVYISV